MTATIAVPVDLIKRLKDNYPATVRSTQSNPIRDIYALLPEPVKVGDHLTEEQIAALPVRSVVVDEDGDLWTVGRNGTTSLVGFTPDGRPRNDGGSAEELAGYNNTLVHIGGKSV